MCALPLEKALRIRFTELVVDLLQDSSGCWWLLQVKAFTLATTRPVSAATVSSLSSAKTSCLSRTQSAPTRFEVGTMPTPQWRKWRCAGRYCTSKKPMKNASEPANQQVENDVDGTNDDKEPCGYLTKKMLRSCEFYDDFVQQQDMSLAGGFTEFHSALTFHLQHRLPKRDRSQLYEPQPLCSACLKRYHSLRQQWVETLDASKSITISNTTVGHHRKKAHDKMYSVHAEQNMLLPRKLPSLHHEAVVLSGTNSTLAFPTSNIASMSNNREDSITVSKQLTYLDELAAMEEMLEEHKPPSILLITNDKPQSLAQEQTAMSTSLSPLTALPTKLSGQDDIFPSWDGVSRIEEMWQNLTFKPLERQLANPGLTSNDDGGIKQGYNSISLQQELTKATMDIQHCRRVFEDENYRENLVHEVLSALNSGNANVYLMALRSLYIDVKQAIAALSDDLSPNSTISSWPMRPKLCRETSGCVTVKLGPV
ncbi:hypothetical protein PHPALM_29156 [Phytophthora palmivora]|uniref:Uncharacterized protein n=1 Tax=Phytophthora palmivora TaxID=4796 RepID=A0A2P4X8A3_9STRA|nr:hypothetical protein PHPALM_29156 [Phytophthora palmivora]